MYVRVHVSAREQAKPSEWKVGKHTMISVELFSLDQYGLSEVV